MVSTQDLQELLTWKPEGEAPILSLYVDRKTGTGFWNAKDLAPLVKGLIKDVAGENGVASDPALEEALNVVLAAIAGGIWTERSIAVFAEPGGRVKTLEWNLAVASQARWGESPYLLPLLEALGGQERWAVVLVDRARARLFTLALGEIEEEFAAFNPEDVRHVASTGSDQARTMNLQRRADEHAHLHFKHVTAILDDMVREERFDRLTIGGPTEPAGRLRELLSPRLAAGFSGFLHVPVEAAKEEVLAAALEVTGRAAEERIDADVRELETASAKKERAAAGLDGTLEALREGRIRRLLYAEGLALRGRRCASCGSLFDHTAKRCLYCRGATSPVDDLLNEIAGRVAKSGGRVESVGLAGGQRLRELGGVGAFLRF